MDLFMGFEIGSMKDFHMELAIGMRVEKIVGRGEGVSNRTEVGS